MTTNRTSRAAADLDRALSGGHVDPAVAGLVAVAGALAAIPQRSAPAFREGLRSKLMAEAAMLAASVPAASVPAASVPSPRPPRSVGRMLQHPAVQAATGGLAATIAVTGAGIGASRSVPGDALYGLKRAVERLQVGAAGGDTDEASALLGHAQTRLDEVRALLGNGELTGDALARVEDTLRELTSELRRATDRLLAEARAGSQAAYDELNRLGATISAEIMALLPRLPDSAATVASASLATLNAARALLAATPRPGATRLPASPTPTRTPTGPAPTSTKPGGVLPTDKPVVTTTPVAPPTSVKPPVSVPVTTPPLPTIDPTLPVTLPPVLP